MAEWQARSIWKYFPKIQPAVLTVGGWFDAEDLAGPQASASSFTVIR
jgi:predicted acyl esterase